MIRSRRIALAALVVVFGLSACGDPSTTTPLAEQPKVIQLASGQSGGAAPTAAAATAEAADSKMAFFGATEFVYDGELPALDTPAGSWFFQSGQQPDLDRVAKLAAALGVEGDVRTVPAEQGGGWAVGPEDYSAAVLTVGSDGMLSWWLSSAPTSYSGVACDAAVSTGAPDASVGVAGVAGTAPGVATKVDEAVALTLPADPAVGEPTTIAVADCPVPQPPVGVPTKDEALTKAKQLFADWGYDVDSYQFDDPYADEWSASVNASLLLDGMKAPVMLSVGFGENGAVTYASGSFAMPQRGSDYPTIGAAAGLERLKDQQNQYIGVNAPGVRTAIDDTTGVAVSDVAVAPDVAPCEGGAAVDCAPVQSEPVTVHLNSVKADLTMQWSTDNTIWLLPAYSFGSADGGIYTVLAVDDAYIQQPDPAASTTETIAVTDPGAVASPETTVGARADGTACPTLAPLSVSSAPVEKIGDAIVGYCLADGQELAKIYGYEVRVVTIDGVDQAATADFSETRINVALKGGIVAAVVSIG